MRGERRYIAVVADAVVISSILKELVDHRLQKCRGIHVRTQHIGTMLDVEAGLTGVLRLDHASLRREA